MEKKTSFAWIDFYMEFANELLKYKTDHAELVEKIKGVFSKIGMNLPTLEMNGDVYDIDPFTVFGLFNKGITDDNRIRIISGFAEEFEIASAVPTSFEGIPVLNNQKATFYWFADGRGDHDIDNLWTVFCDAVNYADKGSSESREQFIKSSIM